MYESASQAATIRCPFCPRLFGSATALRDHAFSMRRKSATHGLHRAVTPRWALITASRCLRTASGSVTAAAIAASNADCTWRMQASQPSLEALWKARTRLGR